MFLFRPGIPLALAAFALSPAGSATAQSCAAPLVLAANTLHVLDTCDGDPGVPLACGGLFLTGPAAIVDLDVPYPAGRIVVQQHDVHYEPVVFLFRADLPCAGNAPCPAADWVGPGHPGVIDLATVDSGHYRLAIATDLPPPWHACGHVLVTWQVTPEQQALMHEGVFRGGNTPIRQPRP